MKIEYRQKGGAGGYQTLMDAANGDTLPVWAPTFNSHAQVEELASNAGQGAGVYTNALGNIRSDIPLRGMNVLYASNAAALAASRTVPSAFLNLRMVLKVTEGTEIQYFDSVVARSCKADVAGRCVTYDMELVGSGTPVAADPT